MCDYFLFICITVTYVCTGIKRTLNKYRFKIECEKIENTSKKQR